MNIFTEDIFDIEQKSVLNRKSKDYPASHKTKWEHIMKMIIVAILFISIGFVFTQVLIEFGAVMAILYLVGMYVFFKVLSFLIG